MLQTAAEQTGLEELVEASLPDPVAWAPQTAGWYVLFAILALATIWAAWRTYRRWHANRYRRFALEQLRSIEGRLSGGVADGRTLAELPRLVKRTTLAFAARSDVAELSNERWLKFLDATYDGRSFSEGPGRLLPVLAYGSPDAVAQIEPGDLSSLFSLIRRWIRRHRAGV
jgi:hypothetical protein